MHTLALGYEQHEVKIMTVRVMRLFMFPNMLLQQLDVEKRTLAAPVPEGLDVVDG
jgi:hypothetical protein